MMLPFGGGHVRRMALALGLAAVGGSVPWWGTRALGTLAFFRIRSVEVEGAHYVPPDQIVERLHVDTLMSVWGDLSPLEARLRAMPGVRGVSVRRMLPGTIVVRVAERVPIAFVPTSGGLRPYDGSATALPIDPTRTDLDLPILQTAGATPCVARGSGAASTTCAAADAGTLSLLAGLRTRVPAFYAEISEVRRAPAGYLIFQLPGLRVLASAGTSADRFATVLPITADLARRRVHAQELDLRFRDQVVARLQ
jgi:cell division protein FtsQ